MPDSKSAAATTQSRDVKNLGLRSYLMTLAAAVASLLVFAGVMMVRLTHDQGKFGYPAGEQRRPSMQLKLGRLALRTAWLYGLVGALWILLSDRLLVVLISDPLTVNRLQTFKGWAFVGVTAVLLYVTLRRPLKHWEQENAARERSEAALRQSQLRLAGIVNTAMDAIISVDGEHRIVLFNAAAEKMFGRSAREVRGQTVDQFIPVRLRAVHAEHIRRFAQTGVTGQQMEVTRALVGLRADGQEFPIEGSAISQSEMGGEKLFTVILRDVTERKRAEALQEITEDLERRVAERTAELLASRAQLRALTERLHTLQEEERAQLARELHDEFGGALTALKLDLHWIMARLPERVGALEEKAGGMSKLIDDTVESVRRTATLLRPHLLDDFGLVAAIEWQMQEFEQRTGIRCVTLLPESIDLDHGPSTALYRILQEALTNVARHAEATEVAVRLQMGGGKVSLEVKDNGIGIDPLAISNEKSVGLFGMQERAYAYGGHVRFEGRPQQGTTVTVEIPLDRRA